MIYVGDDELELDLNTTVNKNQTIEVQFDCLRSYEEKTVYLKGKDRIQFSILYNYASFQYRRNDLLPQMRVSDILCKRGSFTAEAFFPQT